MCLSLSMHHAIPSTPDIIDVVYATPLHLLATPASICSKTMCLGGRTAPNVQLSSHLVEPYLVFPPEQPKRGDVEAFYQEMTSNTLPSSGMAKISVVFTGSHATPNQWMARSVWSRNIELAQPLECKQETTSSLVGPSMHRRMDQGRTQQRI